MTKDFAGRGRSGNRKPAKRKPTRRVSPKQRVLFHGPSFAAGALVGAAIVILAAYGPELFPIEEGTPVAVPAERTATPTVEFEFEELLKNMEVKPDPEPYAVPPEKSSDAPGSFSIQAASFKRRDDAERLRARLLLEDLQAATRASDVDGQRWYRVVVGPFDRRLDADRAMTRLRELNLSAMRINNHN